MSSRARSVPVVPVAVVAVGVAALVAAALLWRTATPTEFGWFAYAPLTDPVEVPVPSLLTPRHGVALALGAVGVGLLGGVGGYLLGTRRRDRSGASGPGADPDAA